MLYWGYPKSQRPPRVTYWLKHWPNGIAYAVKIELFNDVPRLAFFKLFSVSGKAQVAFHLCVVTARWAFVLMKQTWKMSFFEIGRGIALF